MLGQRLACRSRSGGGVQAVQGMCAVRSLQEGLLLPTSCRRGGKPELCNRLPLFYYHDGYLFMAKSHSGTCCADMCRKAYRAGRAPAGCARGGA